MNKKRIGEFQVTTSGGYPCYTTIEMPRLDKRIDFDYKDLAYLEHALAEVRREMKRRIPEEVF